MVATELQCAFFFGQCRVLRHPRGSVSVDNGHTEQALPDCFVSEKRRGGTLISGLWRLCLGGDIVLVDIDKIQSTDVPFTNDETLTRNTQVTILLSLSPPPTPNPSSSFFHHLLSAFVKKNKFTKDHAISPSARVHRIVQLGIARNN